MEVSTGAEVKDLYVVKNEKDITGEFVENSNKLGNETLKADKYLFIQAANKKNVEFEFIRLKSFDLNKISFDISNGRNALLEADYAIADSGLLIVDTKDTDVLLTVFGTQTLHIAVPASKILYSMDDFELIAGKSAISMGRGIASTSVSAPHKKLCFSPDVRSTMVYVLEDV